jgi:hypothetical protein
VAALSRLAFNAVGNECTRRRRALALLSYLYFGFIRPSSCRLFAFPAHGPSRAPLLRRHLEQRPLRPCNQNKRRRLIFTCATSIFVKKTELEKSKGHPAIAGSSAEQILEMKMLHAPLESFAYVYCDAPLRGLGKSLWVALLQPVGADLNSK